MTKKFEELIQSKDDEISKLQIQLGENPINSPQMVEGLEDIDLHNNLDLDSQRLNNDIDTDILNNLDNDNKQHLNIEGLESEHHSINNLNEENVLDSQELLKDNKYFKGLEDN